MQNATSKLSNLVTVTYLRGSSMPYSVQNTQIWGRPVPRRADGTRLMLIAAREGPRGWAEKVAAQGRCFGCPQLTPLAPSPGGSRTAAREASRSHSGEAAMAFSLWRRQCGPPAKRTGSREKNSPLSREVRPRFDTGGGKERRSRTRERGHWRRQPVVQPCQPQRM